MKILLFERLLSLYFEIEPRKLFGGEICYGLWKHSTQHPRGDNRMIRLCWFCATCHQMKTPWWMLSYCLSNFWSVISAEIIMGGIRSSDVSYLLFENCKNVLSPPMHEKFHWLCSTLVSSDVVKDFDELITENSKHIDKQVLIISEINIQSTQ